jgi:DNA-binding XRE family transcriptional regulator
VDNPGMSPSAARKIGTRKLGPGADARLLRAQMGARLKDARLAIGYRTAKGLAEAIGENPQTYRNYERGGGIPPDTMIALAQMGISINYLYLGIGPKTIPEIFQSVA